MKITVFGAGAVGGHIAAKLAAFGPAAGLEVAAVARGAHLAAMRTNGLVLWIGDERIAAPIRATDRPAELGTQDLVIVTLKSSVLPGAAVEIASLLGPETAVIFAMNGIPWWYLYGLADNGLSRPNLAQLDPGGVLAATIGFERVIGCMINSANAIVEPGVIRNASFTRNRFTLGEPDGTISKRLKAIAAALEAGGLAVPVTAAIRIEIWEKLLRNVSTSPICAISGEPIGAIGRHPELFALSRRLMEEALAVALAHGIDPGVDIDRVYATRHDTPHKSSMLQDFERGRPPEIDGLLVALQQFARAAAVATPHLDAVTALVIEKARRMGLYPAAEW